MARRNPLTALPLEARHRYGVPDYTATQHYMQHARSLHGDDQAGVCNCAGSVVIDHDTGMMNVNMGTDHKDFNMWVRLSSDDLLVMLKHAIKHEMQNE